MQQSQNRSKVDALRAKARLRIAAERELAEIIRLPLREYASASALVEASQARGNARLSADAGPQEVNGNQPRVRQFA
jgi:hypothetical protein